ncbi:MAG TPA: thiamine-phosphate kinase [Burkholderiaceae bacterium]|nr:thiamine-phosphate kinase [Burkholderiaceae bacterium]
MALGEFDLIARYFKRPARRAVLGVGDDCALLAPSVGMQLAVSSDLLIEGRHFLSTVPPQALGHKALAVNLSDLAACAATPLAFTLMLALPRVDEEFLRGFSEGLLALADLQAIELVGGDTTAGLLTVGITVLGEVPPGAALRRGAARVGDDLWVSHPHDGGIGDARLALEVFRGQAELPGQSFAQLRRAMEWPQPRVALGVALRGVAHAAIDLSDGLAGDLGHVLAQSQVGATLDWAALPRSSTLATQPLPLQKRCLLDGGDDYELLFSAPTSACVAVQRAADQAAVAVSRIGEVQAETGLRVRWPDGTISAWATRGFDHFASASA